jgi:Family of unknown function (DUF5343)
MATKMSLKLPYMLATGLIPKVLEKIQQARRPDRFTQDFLGTVLGYGSGSARPIIPLLKRMGFLASDGSPTARYDRFRNVETQGAAVAEGIRTAYPELFDRNEYVYKLSRDRLAALVVETTGGARDDRSIKAVVGTFSALNEMADFETDAAPNEAPERVPAKQPPQLQAPAERVNAASEPGQSVDFKVSYTINLNLPESTDPDVFNAIFRSLKENLLKE